MPDPVDVVILTWNDGELLLAAAESVWGSEGVATRLTIVDNGSDPPAALSGGAVEHQLRSPRNLGVSVGRTLGVAAGTAPTVCFLDSDARLLPSTLRRLVARLEGDPSIGLVAPVFDGQNPVESGGRAPTLATKLLRGLNRRNWYQPGTPGPDGLIDVDFAIGACQVFRRAAWEEVGGLDTSYFYGPEDVDFCLRLKGAGWRIVQDPDAVCHHPPRRRYKNVMSRRGALHAWAVMRHLWRHRRFGRPRP